MPHRLSFLLALVAFPAVAHADVRYDMQMQDVERGSSMRTQVLVKDGMIRFSMSDGAKDASSDMIYRPRSQDILMIDHKSREVRRMTKADMDGLQAMMAANMARMQEALKAMPPEARAQAEAAMGKMPGMGAAPQVEKTVTAMGRADTVAGIDCDMYQVLENGVKTGEICAADPDDLAGSDDMMAAMKSLAGLTADFLKGAGAQTFVSTFDPVDGGFPILTRQFVDGALAFESRFVSMAETSLGADQFEAPAGYRERGFME